MKGGGKIRDSKGKIQDVTDDCFVWGWGGSNLEKKIKRPELAYQKKGRTSRSFGFESGRWWIKT